MADTDPANTVDPTQPTTPDRVRSIAHHLISMSDADLQLCIDDAFQEIVDTTDVNSKYYERLSRYLAAHYASLNVRQANVEHVGPIQREYNLSRTGGETGANGVQSTPYGLEYLRLMRRLTGRGRLNLAVY
ncbi:MAG: DUF4054 domain-containing protein [Sporolactobacillus sp.]